MGIAICEPPNQRPVMTMCFFSSFSTDKPLQMEIANASIERPIARTSNSAKFIFLATLLFFNFVGKAKK